LSVKRFFQSLGYERSGELPWIARKLQPQFKEPLRYLDVGSGDSVFPTFILSHTNWDVTCVDKFAWVSSQSRFAGRLGNGLAESGRLHVIEKDLLQTDLPEASFDVITNISVIEHFEGELDSVAMAQTARLLKPGGVYIVTTPLNEGHARDFYMKRDVYGEKYSNEGGGSGVFFQRHYDVQGFEQRVIQASGLVEQERVYFGDYGFQFCENFMVVPWPWKVLKLAYQWATPVFARRFLTYRDYPVSRADMHMYTAAGVMSVLRRPAD
jgi:SAM-dependent methyltransferase